MSTDTNIVEEMEANVWLMPNNELGFISGQPLTLTHYIIIFKKPKDAEKLVAKI
jgi:hypothetical protein